MNILDLKNNIIKNLAENQVLIVGIDGLGGAGKSTVSEELCKLFRDENYSVTVLHIDDFIHPKSVRYNENYEEWECYYNLQWRYDYFLNDVIMPIKNNGYFCGEIELYDKENDKYYLSKTDIPSGSILIVEGIFLQRSELEGIFDYMIFMDVPEEVRLSRVLKRDGYIGDEQQIRKKYENRYFPAEHRYIAKCSPVESADYVIN